MANMYFNDDFEVCSISKDPAYLYIDDVDKFLHDCGNGYVSDGVDKSGVYLWNDYYCVWDLADPEIDKKIKAIVEEITSLRQELPRQSNNTFTNWNILVTLDTDETIKINSEPVSINDIHEVIDTLLKPSFFGKRIKKFEIVAE